MVARVRHRDDVLALNDRPLGGRLRSEEAVVDPRVVAASAPRPLGGAGLGRRLPRVDQSQAVGGQATGDADDGVGSFSLGAFSFFFLIVLDIEIRWLSTFLFNRGP